MWHRFSSRQVCKRFLSPLTKIKIKSFTEVFERRWAREECYMLGLKVENYLNLWIICNHLSGTYLCFCHTILFTASNRTVHSAVNVLLCPDEGYVQGLAFVVLQVILIKLMTLLIRFLVIQNNVEMHFTFILNVWCNVFTLLEPVDFLNSSNMKRWEKT